MRRHTRVVLLACSLAACGDDGGDGGSPDARDQPDADATPVLCLDTDTACGYAPEPVTPDDVALADQQTLAERFAPNVVYTGDDMWGVSVDMLLEQGVGGLQRAEHDGKLNFSYDVDEATTEAVARDLAQAFTDLPTTAPGGRGYAYFLDFPGDNAGNDYGEETWSAEWQTIQGSDDPTAAAYPPTTYAHLFWLSKDDRVLAIQYWFFYPYDKFTNNHEGDWEHVNVVLHAPATGEPAILGAHFSFHGRQFGVLADELYATGEHLVVFAGGDACLNYVNECWCGDTSGAMFPWPGQYDLGYWEVIDGTTASPGRAIEAADFTVELLPRLEDVDFAARPTLSWYALPFLFGAPTTESNAPAVISTNNHRSPVGPGPEQDEFEVGIEDLDPIDDLGTPQPFDPPSGWTLTHEPPAATFETPAQVDNCTP